MLKPLIFLSMGIAAGYYIPASFTIWGILASCCLCSGILLMVLKLSHTSWITLSGLLLLLSLFALGAGAYSIQERVVINPGFYHYKASVGKIIQQQEGYTRCILDIRSFDSLPVSDFKIIANITGSGRILPGDELWVSSYVREMNGSLNLGQFNTKKYYSYKHIYYTTSLKPHQFVQKVYDGRLNITRSSYLAALWCGEQFRNFMPERSAHTMQAILLGIKHEISDEMIKVYTNTGVMHILAVSGMHVGILYVGVVALMRRLIRKWRWLTIIPVILVWIFSYVTGAGPAILRAAVMITLVDIGEKTGNRSDSMNLLLAAGFLLLMVQPYLLWDIGFQLSYAAMFALLIYMKPLTDILYVENYFAREYIWKPSVMSVSAQMVTTPLTFFYFGNFPTLFLLTNMLVLLPVTVALYGGVLMLISSVILPDTVTIWLGKLMDITLYYGFDELLRWVTKFPGAYSDQIYLAYWQVIVLLIAIACLGVWMYRLKEGKWFLSALLLLTITVSGSAIRKWYLMGRQTISVLQVPDKHVIAVNNFLWHADIPRVQLEDKAGFFINGMLRQTGWKHWTNISPSFVRYNDTMFVAGGYSFLVLNESLFRYSDSIRVQVDYIIPGNDLYLNTEQLLQRFEFRAIILDGSLNYKKYDLFKRLLDKAQIPYYDTRTDGAMMIPLKKI